MGILIDLAYSYSMLRFMLMISLVVVGILQGIALGNVDTVFPKSDQQEVIDTLAFADGNTSDTVSDHLIDNLPTICKLDCKALVPLLSAGLGKLAQEHEILGTENRALFVTVLNLRPPIV